MKHSKKVINLAKKIVVLLLTLGVLFIIAEQIVRFESFGVNAFSPRMMENIRHSTTYQFRSGDCDMTANYSDYFKGAYLETNSLGNRDREYSLKKSNNTFRIAVLGDSNTVGEGVDIDKVYHTVLETRLNNRSVNKTFEVITFARGGIQIKNCYFKKLNDSLHFDPDMILVQLNEYSKFQRNLSNLEKFEPYHNENAHIVMMFYRPKQDYMYLLEQNVSFPIVSANVDYDHSDMIYPADWHFDEHIHHQIADFLYGYFLDNEQTIYTRTQNFTKAQNLSELNYPNFATKRKHKNTGFKKSYLLEKIEKRYEFYSKKSVKNWQNFLDKFNATTTNS